MDVTNAVDAKLFGKWQMDDLVCNEISLEDYIQKNPIFTPHTAGRYQRVGFRKALCPIVERMACSLMMHGRNNGKKVMAVRIMRHAMEIIHLLTEQNPVQVCVEAVINCGPREDSTRVGGGGAVRSRVCGY